MIHIHPEIELRQHDTDLEVMFTYHVPKCPGCDHPLETDDSAIQFHLSHLHYDLTQIRASSGLELDNRPLCVTCAKEGKGKFVCEGCKHMRTSDKIHLYWPTYRVYLCTQCFLTSSAKDWGQLLARFNHLSQHPRRL